MMPLALMLLKVLLLVEPGVSFQIEAKEVRDLLLVTFLKFRSKIRIRNFLRNFWHYNRFTMYNSYTALFNLNVESGILKIYSYFGAPRHKKIKRRCTEAAYIKHGTYSMCTVQLHWEICSSI